MPTQPSERIRLRSLMEDRLLELNLRWQDVADEGGVSLRVLSTARTGTAEILPRTRRGIAKGLRWTPDSVDRILDGRDPMASPGSPGYEPAAGEWDTSGVSEAEIKAEAEGILTAASAVERATGRPATPEELFPGSSRADKWERYVWADDGPAAERAEDIATARAIRRARGRRSGENSALYRASFTITGSI
jgi:hypothetical protein